MKCNFWQIDCEMKNDREILKTFSWNKVLLSSKNFVGHQIVFVSPLRHSLGTGLIAPEPDFFMLFFSLSIEAGRGLIVFQLNLSILYFWFLRILSELFCCEISTSLKRE